MRQLYVDSNKLVERSLYESLFKEINNQLETQGIKVRKAEAALLDATIITSAARPRATIEEATGEVKKDVIQEAQKSSNFTLYFLAKIQNADTIQYYQHTALLSINLTNSGGKSNAQRANQIIEFKKGEIESNNMTKIEKCRCINLI